MDHYVEIIRSLYHIDYIRRKFRALQHTECTGNSGTSSNSSIFMRPCPTCEIKDLFSVLSDSMRGSEIDPVQLSNLITSRTRSIVSKIQSPGPGSSIYSRLLSLFPRGGAGGLGLSTTYSLTKACLECNTCSHIETVEKYSHKIETLPEKYYPSFEFGLKSSLDHIEFCDKLDCFGSLRVFRVLKETPQILAFEFDDPSVTTSSIPEWIKPCLIFECPSSTDLRLTCLTLRSTPARRPGTLFYHSRLQIWILLDSTSITPIPTFADVQQLQLPISIAFYTCSPNDQPHKLISPEQVRKPTVVEPRVTSPKSPRSPPATPIRSRPGATIPTSNPPLTPPVDSRIYENWPIHPPHDTDSGHGDSELTTSLCETTSNVSAAGGSRWGDEEEVLGKYATIKRRKSKINPAPPVPLSVSIPDLRPTSSSSDLKRVSFDCQVTLVEEDEYIPHPILQSILQQMRL